MPTRKVYTFLCCTRLFQWQLRSENATEIMSIVCPVSDPSDNAPDGGMQPAQIRTALEALHSTKLHHKAVENAAAASKGSRAERLMDATVLYDMVRCCFDVFLSWLESWDTDTTFLVLLHTCNRCLRFRNVHTFLSQLCHRSGRKSTTLQLFPHRNMRRLSKTRQTGDNPPLTKVSCLRLALLSWSSGRVVQVFKTKPFYTPTVQRLPNRLATCWPIASIRSRRGAWQGVGWRRPKPWPTPAVQGKRGESLSASQTWFAYLPTQAPRGKNRLWRQADISLAFPVALSAFSSSWIVSVTRRHISASFPPT